ncbi:hypothetical protein NDU88_003006 [Pleurodeles waltl]|uniref:Reverse transcriptase n=1 Tax=Pleurodeles waltl TaxID=8319 RepID=A0AAV7TM87_PLEWA|nr:hypothetical protein NDU88_003006 [Pleurodeles waltl]
MLRTPCACSTDRCRRFTAFWWPLQGSWPRRQAPEGPARRHEHGARPRSTLLFLSTERDPRRFLATLVGVWGVWDARMAPKLNRTPRSLRARQNQDPGGTRKDKKLPVPGLKEHSNPHVKGGLHKTTDMEKDARYSVPTMFTSMMRLKKRSTEKAACDSQSNVPGVDDEQIRAFLLTSMTQGWHIDKIKLMEVSQHPTSCGIKNLYPLLLNAIQDDLALLVKKWEGRVVAKETEVCESMEMARTVLLSAGPQAQHFMVLYNLYYRPTKIASWGKTVGIMCPRCGCPKADLCHMFFQCVKLESLITGISDILKKILKQAIYLTPQMVLLGIDNSVCNSRDRYFLFIAMSVFRSCIASLWCDVDPPRLNQWFSRLLSMYHLENSLYELKGAAAGKRLTRVWAPFSAWLLGPENMLAK